MAVKVIVERDEVFFRVNLLFMVGPKFFFHAITIPMVLGFN